MISIKVAMLSPLTGEEKKKQNYQVSLLPKLDKYVRFVNHKHFYNIRM